MVEKIWVCLSCHYTPQNIPYDEQPRICPKCGLPCKEMDVIHQEDFKAILEDMRREGENSGVTSYRTKKD